MTLRAVITAGGTSEPIDDVRVVTNFSTGRFGAALAGALAERGVEVTLIASHALAAHPQWIDPRVHVVPFGSTVQLQQAIHDATEVAPDLLFMAAAVSDYAPIPVNGKIRSNEGELVVRMVRTPKILPTLRARCPKTKICGFKLLSGVSSEELIAVARAQIDHAQLDLCLANDLQELVGQHPAWIVTSQVATRIEGQKADTAAALADAALQGLAPTVTTPHDTVDVQLDPNDGPTIDALSDALDRAQRWVRTQSPSPWIARGWKRERDRPMPWLSPPSMRSDRRPAASIALWHAASRRILMGRRTAGAYLEHWAFPGGGVESGEDLIEAALRELHEETGVQVPLAQPVLVTTLTVGTPERAWLLTNFLVEVPDCDAPIRTDELDARWLSLPEALALELVAAGTARVLRRIAAHLS